MLEFSHSRTCIFTWGCNRMWSTFILYFASTFNMPDKSALNRGENLASGRSKCFPREISFTIRLGSREEKGKVPLAI